MTEITTSEVEKQSPFESSAERIVLTAEETLKLPDVGTDTDMRAFNMENVRDMNEKTDGKIVELLKEEFPEGIALLPVSVYSSFFEREGHEKVGNKVKGLFWTDGKLVPLEAEVSSVNDHYSYITVEHNGEAVHYPNPIRVVREGQVYVVDPNAIECTNNWDAIRVGKNRVVYETDDDRGDGRFISIFDNEGKILYSSKA